jgi:hypothetical protein
VTILDMTRSDHHHAHAWSARATKYVSAWQEREWGEVGEHLGLGWDPVGAHRQFSSGLVPDEAVAPKLMREQLGLDLAGEIYAGAADELERLVEEYAARYFVEPPTPFDEPGLQSTMVQLLDEVTPAIEDSGFPLLARPLVATMPSSEVHARTRSIPGTNEAAILFQTGLMMFLRDFARVLALAMPFHWLELAINTPLERSGVPGDAAHTDRAVRLLGASLVAFVVEGDLRETPYVALERHAVVSSYMLLHHMELSALCHELAHLQLGHLLPAAVDLSPWDKEYGADQVGSTMASRTAQMSGAGLNSVVGLWMYELVLAAFDLVERALSYLETGRIDGSAGRTHPPPADRQRELLRRNMQGFVEAGLLAESVRLERRTVDAANVIERLWLATKPTWDSLRDRQVRPSPIWKNRSQG